MRARRRPARPGRGPGSAPRRGWPGCGRRTGCPAPSSSRPGSARRSPFGRLAGIGRRAASRRTVAPVRGCFAVASPWTATASTAPIFRTRDRREERRHAEVVGLAPAVERVMVALGTGDAHAEEHLRQRARRLARLRRRPCRRSPAGDLVERPFGRQQLAGELVERLVLRDGCRESSGSRRRPAAARAPAGRRAAGRPTSAPSKSANSGRSSSSSTSFARLSGGVSARNAPGLGRRRQRADHVEVDAAQELGVVARSDGTMFSFRSLASTRRSMKLSCGSFGNVDRLRPAGRGRGRRRPRSRRRP